jgi:hypothetical protein
LNILQSFLAGLFGSLAMGTLFNSILAIYFFMNNKRRWNEYTWSSFRIPLYMLGATISIGISLYYTI